MGLVTRMLKRFGYVPAKRSVFLGAAQNRLTADWIMAASLSPLMELQTDLRTLRDRARDLERSSPLIRRYLNLVAENVIGHHGIRLQAKNTLPDGRLNKQANAQLEAGWAEWQRPEHCTAEGRLCWNDFLAQVARSLVRDGEVFIRVLEGVNDYGFCVQQFDPELVDESYSLPAGPNNDAIRMGVEVNQWGRPTRYHVFGGHPYDFTITQAERARIVLPADEVIHLFLPRRPWQTRGESHLAPVMIPIRMRDGYTEAELVAARTAAAKMGFITPGEDADGPDPDAPDQEMSADPGAIETLAKGETFTPWDPTHPSGNYGAFVQNIDRVIAAGLNVSYMALTGDLTQTNYSSARVGLLQERDAWRRLQHLIATHICERVYTRWRDVAWRKGRIGLRMAPSEYGDHHWQGRGWPWVDPQKDVQAAAMAVAFGFTSPQRVVGEEGKDLEEIYEEISAADELADLLDVDIKTPQGVTDATDDGTNGTGDGGDGGSADAGDGGGSGGAGRAGGRRRPDPRLALVRGARGTLVRDGGAGPLGGLG